MAEVLDLGIEPPGAPELDAATLNELGDQAVEAAEAEQAAGAAPVEVSEAQVRVVLAAVGGLAGWALGDKRIDGHWRFTADELDELAPPITRIVNRNPVLARVVANSDAAVAGMVLFKYVLRNIDLAAKAKKEAESAERNQGPTPGDDGSPALVVPAGNGALGSHVGPGGR